MQAIRREERIRKALIDNKTTTDGNISQAARNNDVARTTLLHRRDGRPSRAFTRPSNARLTYQQEEVLAKLIANQQAQFMPTSHTQIRTIAYLMSKDLNGQDGPIGINWVTKFINRHANIKSRKELYLDIDRVSASNPAILDTWFSAAQLALQGQQVDDQDVWNMDEVGARRNYHQSEHSVFDRRQGPPIVAKGGSTDWTTSLECINAAGGFLRPLVIHRGTAPQTPLNYWFPASETLPNWHWGFTESGWTTEAYTERWFEDIFLPESAREGREGKTRVLYLDGHSSHITGNIQWLAHQNNVILIWILPHSSHLIQPLDQQPFAILKASYARLLKAFDPDGNRKVTRAQFDVLWA